MVTGTFTENLQWGYCCKQQGSASVKTHRWHHTAGADAVVEAGPALVVGVLALVQHVLVAGIIGLLVGHPTTALHSYWVTTAEVVLHLRIVTAALIVTTLEVPVFVENNLRTRDSWTLLPQEQTDIQYTLQCWFNCLPSVQTLIRNDNCNYGVLVCTIFYNHILSYFEPGLQIIFI